MNNITMFQTAINEFAKANKVNRGKLEAFTAAIVASIPANVSSGKQGRPMLEKTAALHQDIIQTVNNGFKGQRNAVLVRNVIGCDKVQFNNAVAALVKQGKLFHAGKAKTGSRGRQPFILSTSKPE